MQACLSHHKKMGKTTSKLNHQTTKQHYILAIDITFAKGDYPIDFFMI